MSDKLTNELVYEVLGDLIYDFGRMPTIVEALTVAREALQELHRKREALDHAIFLVEQDHAQVKRKADQVARIREYCNQSIPECKNYLGGYELAMFNAIKYIDSITGEGE